ncbi:MAG TPA: DUF2235 domain-containing protein [Dyella sp.]|uniref:T6SS phospholipase effector Tle1-like catalytic domain-containing protein n=1 Tax=Dyella sp. TaxID=1869338 RepID=UPI002B8BCA36|nr:DUF2235 domain-containing protein [Dyella sp.]HTV87154.1 DUF2235 domain-containing protein [Dyella sp.]
MAMEVRMHPLGPTPGIIQALPTRIPRTEHCEFTLHIGLFFDGTGNNKDWDNADDCTKGKGTQYERRCHSNVARLFGAYPANRPKGYYPIYIEGLGTPCPAIGEDTPTTLGGAMAEGGDGRINLGLLQLLNTIHIAASPTNQPALTDDIIKALCRHGRGSLVTPSSPVLSAQVGPFALPPLSDDAVTLAKVNRSTVGGLLMGAFGTDREHALSFYRGQIYAITQFLQNSPRPKPIEIMLDVFGFSRGAAEARVFCSWLSELAPQDTLCGLPLTTRFLGLFDTVASVGIPSAPASTYNLTNGHFAWAQPQSLRVPTQVKNCLHLVAMHENRASFPLDLVRTEGGLPSNCQEFAFPGMHSDVGGGYAPNEQGRGTIGGSLDAQDSDKLSQVSLSIMLKAAQAAGVPLDTTLAYNKDEKYTPFIVDKAVQTAYENFHRLRGNEQRQMGDWLLSYLAWRYQVRAGYSQLPWHARAHASDRDDLDGANGLLRDDIASLDNTEGVWKSTYSQAWDKLLGITFVRNDAKAVRHMAPEARDILKRLRAQPASREAEALIFSTYAHDSVAGFRPFDQIKILCHEVLPMHWDLEGYLRYRRFWTGNDKALTLLIEPPKPSLYEEQAAQMQQTVNMKGYGIGDVFPPGGW